MMGQIPWPAWIPDNPHLEVKIFSRDSSLESPPLPALSVDLTKIHCLSQKIQCQPQIHIDILFEHPLLNQTNPIEILGPLLYLSLEEGGGKLPEVLARNFLAHPEILGSQVREKFFQWKGQLEEEFSRKLGQIIQGFKWTFIQQTRIAKTLSQSLNPFSDEADRFLKRFPGPDSLFESFEVFSQKSHLREIHLYCSEEAVFQGISRKENFKLNLELKVSSQSEPTWSLPCHFCKTSNFKGLFCKLGHYLCPDHGSRCQECHQFICPQCEDPLFTCLKCNRLSCESHREKCRHCQETICFQHQITCKTCSLPSCYQCMETCNHCSELHCQEHIRLCQSEGCHHFICQEGTKSCQSCQKSGCPEHFTQGPGGWFCSEHGRPCEACERLFPEEDLYGCEMCAKNLCPEDLDFCQMCRKKGCKTHFKKIEGSREKACPEHFTPCPKCHQVLLKPEISECDFCEESLCQGCMKRCDLCGQTGCSSHFFKNPEGHTLCFKEIGKCSQCKETIELTAILNCELCENQLCSLHILKCEFCEISGCQNHFARFFKGGREYHLCPAHRYICFICEKPIEKKEKKEKKEINGKKSVNHCQVCNNLLCQEHFSQCSHCDLSGCRSHFEKKPDGTLICDRHDLLCQLCKKIIKLKEATHCHVCKKYHCQAHIQECPGCFKKHCQIDGKTCHHCEIDYCSDCSQENGKCTTCDNLKENQIIPHTFFKILNDPSVNKAVENGYYKFSENISFFYLEIERSGLFSGTTRELIILDKIRNRLHRRQEKNS